MSIQKLNADGLGLRFKIKGENVVFLNENGEEKATRPATPAELVLWGELFQKIGELEKVNFNLAKADQETLKLTRLLQEFPGITTEQLRDPVESITRLVRSHEVVQQELQNFANWLDEEFPGELNGTEGVFGTAARLLRGRPTAGSARAKRQRGGMAVREAKRASERRDAAPGFEPVLQEGP